MNELKCPHCGQIFQVDESGYADLVRQVRDEQFTAELHERAEAMERERAQAVELARRDAEGVRQQAVAERDAKIAELQAKLDASAGERELAAQKAAAEARQESERAATDFEGDALLTDRLLDEDIDGCGETHAQVVKELVGFFFEIRVDADGYVRVCHENLPNVWCVIRADDVSLLH